MWISGWVFLFAISALRAEDQNCRKQYHVKELARQTSKYALNSSPIRTPDGTVVVGSHEGILFFLKLDPSSGVLTTKKFQLRSHLTGSPRMLSDSTIMIGCSDGYVYRFTRNGQPINRVSIGFNTLSTPAQMPDGTVVIGSHNGFIHFFNPDGSAASKFRIDGTEIVSTPLVLTSGEIVVGADDGNVYIFNPDRSLKWKVKTESLIYSSATEIFSGRFRGWFVIGSTDKNLYIINPKNGRKRVRSIGSEMASPVRYTRDGHIVVTTNDGRLLVFDLNFKLISEYRTPLDSSGRSPFIWGAASELLDHTLVFAASDGNVYFVNPQDGSLLAKHYIEPGKEIWSGTGIWTTPLVLSRDIVVVAASQDSAIHFLQRVIACKN